MTRILKLQSDSDRSLLLRQAGEVLAAGGLCVFPTETVYGLGASREIPAAIGRLDEAKQRTAGKHYTLMLADKEALPNYVSKIPLIARKVINRFWPGPLTVVFGDIGREGLGVRIPASDTAREIIKAAAQPVLVTSANISGRPPATTAQQAEEALDGLVDMIVDEGPTRMKEPSTVVRFADGRWEVLREGLISRDMIARQATATITFVCTGNTCRSPLAEALFRTLLSERLDCEEDDLEDLGYRVLSAGTEAVAGFGASEQARIVAREFGCNLAEHTTRPITKKLVEQSDMIVAMTRDHLEAAQDMGAEEAQLLTPEGISDPAGGDMQDFRKCADQLEKHLLELVDKII